VVLSGMNSMEMVQENIDTASDVQISEMGPEEEALFARVVEAINENVKVGCTGCGYCMPCPKGVDIPGIFATYNRWHSENKKSAAWEYIQCNAFRKTSTAASNCVGCGKCEQYCPQALPIRQHLKDAAQALETPKYKLIRKAIEVFHIY